MPHLRSSLINRHPRLGIRRSALRRSQSGYIIMVILFMMAVLVFAAAATAPAIKQQLQREREEEMIHRGAQYARAIKRFFKKFGRYPTSLDQLENTNNIRFLRKRYKDPMTADGKWGLLHVGDVKLGTGANVGTPVSAMASPTGAMGQATTGSAFGQPSTSAFGQPSTSAFGQPSTGATGQPGTGGATGQTSASGIIGSTTPAGQSGAQSGSSSTGSQSAFGSSGGVMGGAIIGVASSSEKEGLRTFNEKTHYNQWYFVYDPTADRGGLVSGPFTGKVFTFPGAAGVGTPGVPGAQPAGQQGTFGQPSSFGQPAGQSGFGQSGSFGQPPAPQPKPPQPPQQ